MMTNIRTNQTWTMRLVSLLLSLRLARLVEALKSQAVLMKSIINSWLDETGRLIYAADFLVQSLPDSHYNLSFNSNGIYQEIGFMGPYYF
jgi:hypothetical protein